MDLREKLTGSSTQKDTRDEYSAMFGWKPIGLPEVSLRYNDIRMYDNLKTIDSKDRLLSLDTRYEPLKALQLNYNYTRSDREDTVSNSEAIQQTHNGQVMYSRNFFDRRLSMNTGYRIRHMTQEFPGTDTALSPVLRSAGFFDHGDTPEEGTAGTQVTALIDGDFSVSSGIDIGLAGDETTLTHIGLDFGFIADIDQLYVWVDRSLPDSVANSFTWSVYTSLDNTETSTWTLVATVSPASFGRLENRFEISFPTVETRYVKVVTAPLSPAVPEAALYPNIFVTEMQALTEVIDEADGKKNATTFHNYNLNLVGRIGERLVLGSNANYTARKDTSSIEGQSGGSVSEITGGIYMKYAMSEIFSLNSRFLYTDRKESNDRTTRYSYSSSVKAEYLETLNQTLTYSGTVGSGSISKMTNSLFLRTTADLYTGLNTFVDLGYSMDENEESKTTDSIIIRTGGKIVPNDKITINVNYSRTITEAEEENDTSRSQLTVQAFVVPYKNLSFFAQLSLVDRGGSDSISQNYSLNWSPFSEGDLELFFSYSETLRSGDDRNTRSIGPSLKWRISPHADLDVSYNFIQDDSGLLETDSNTSNVSLRMRF